MVLAIATLTALSLNVKPERVAVLDVRARAGVADGLTQGVTDMVVSEIRKRQRKLSVISSDEIRSLLALEKQRQQLGCESASCLAEIGGALGAQQMVTGALALFGDLYVLTLKRVQVGRAQVLREASGRLQKGSERDFPDLVARLCQSLFSDPSAVEPPPPDLFDQNEADAAPTAPGGRGHAVGWLLLGGAVASAVVATVGFVNVGQYIGERNQIAGGTRAEPYAQVSGDLSGAQGWEGAAIACSVLAAASVTGAIFTW